MTIEDTQYLSNYKENALYINTNQNGGYVTLVTSEIEISKKVKLALQAYVTPSGKNYSSFKLTKLRNEKSEWIEDASLSLSKFDISVMKKFLEMLQGLKIESFQHERIELNKGIDSDSLRSILETSEGQKLLVDLQNNPSLTNDIIAIARKKESLEEFGQLLENFEEYKDKYLAKYKIDKGGKGEENIFQHFFEDNTWIFGYGLNYIFLHKITSKGNYSH